MISREEKNKVLEQEIKQEKAIKISKKFLKGFFLVMLIFAIILVYIYFIGVKNIKTNEYVLYENIPNSFHGIKILHFSDLLYGGTINQKEINYLQDEIKLINPDIVFFTGNLIDNKYELQEDDISQLNTFFKNIPYRIGKFAIRGNLDTKNFDLIMEDTNFTIMDNKLEKIYYEEKDYINIVGFNTDKEKEITQDDKYTICLINNYDDFKKKNINANLIFAGNNLGGEIRIFNLPLLGNNKYPNSYYEENNSKIYISNGLGSIHHMRFMNHPSINVYRLEKKS